MKKPEISEPPKQRIIKGVTLKRLLSWIDYFKKLSNRIIVISRNDENFKETLIKAEKLAIKINDICLDEGQSIIGWPKKDEVAFILSINSDVTGEKTMFLVKDVRIFCFDDKAFGLDYFQWDGDSESGDWSKTYSLENYSKSALSWHYIASLIESDVAELEERVPKPPN